MFPVCSARRCPSGACGQAERCSLGQGCRGQLPESLGAETGAVPHPRRGLGKRGLGSNTGCKACCWQLPPRLLMETPRKGVGKPEHPFTGHTLTASSSWELGMAVPPRPHRALGAAVRSRRRHTHCTWRVKLDGEMLTQAVLTAEEKPDVAATAGSQITPSTSPARQGAGDAGARTAAGAASCSEGTGWGFPCRNWGNGDSVGAVTWRDGSWPARRPGLLAEALQAHGMEGASCKKGEEGAGEG